MTIYNECYNKVVDANNQALNMTKSKCLDTYGEQVLQRQPPIYNETTETFMCPPYWDTLLCWDATPSNSVAIQNCPSYVIGFVPSFNASRQCMENGRWFAKENETWTNYTACYKDKMTTIFIECNQMGIDKTLQEAVPVIQIIAQTGYMVSFITLIVAFGIMLFIKKLHCSRNILHMHLFASFILRAFMFLVVKGTFVEGLALPSDINQQNGSLYFHIDTESNNWPCKLLVSLRQYFDSANYSWILMEGLYLHNLIFRALFVDSNSIKWYVVMGWGMPLIVVGFWIVARLLREDSYCWTMYEDYKILCIVAVPTMISILVNLCLFIRISTVLYSKLKSPINEDRQRYQKWAKSTLVLVPLFGVHYALFLTLYYLNKTNKIVEVVWMICNTFFGTFQGFFVAILYCFLNSEVKSEILPHIYIFLTFLATNKYTKCFFPWRKKFLRSVVGRASVCTTISCSSLYTNGVLHRNSKCRLDSLPKIKTGDKSKDHLCNNQSRRNSRSHRHSQPMAETALCVERSSAKRKSQVEIGEETLKMVQNDF